MENILAELQNSLFGLLPFLAYFIVAVVMLVIFVTIYKFVTPHKEMALIKENNSAASLSLTGTVLGFSIPIASAAANSVGLIDFAVWGVVAGVLQIITFLVFRAFYPQVSSRIEKGETAIGIHLGGVSISVGLLNAACMTY
jgi:putative membrane protein